MSRVARGPVPAALLLAGALAAAEPVVQAIAPRGGRRGTEVAVNFYGRRLGDVEELLCLRPGISLAKVEIRQDRSVRLRLRIAADCPLGEHPLRLRTRTGMSNLVTFHVGVLPEVGEKEPNDTLDKARPIPLGVTVNGVVRPEDEDWFRVEVSRSARVTFELVGMRLGGYPLDAVLSVHDARGALLARAEDSPLGILDPILTCTFEKAGSYFVRVRETAYGGHPTALYRLHVGTFPRPLGALPSGGRPGETIEVRWVGEAGAHREKVKLPARPSPVLARHFPADAHGTAPTPVLLRVADLPCVVETPGKVTVMPAPGAAHGVLARPGEVDVFEFAAKKGRQLEIAVLARRLRSPLDPVVWVRAATGGGVLASNDDAGHPDSRLRFRAPADGRYRLYVRDHLRRGGGEFFYRVEIAPPARAPRTRVAVPGRPQDECAIVPRGGRGATVLAVSNLAPGTRLSLAGLPAGVRATIPPVARGTPLVPVILQADANAGRAAAACTVQATRGDTVHEAGFLQVVPLVRVRNNQVLYSTACRRLPVAVVDPAPFSIELESPTVPLVRGGPLGLRVKVRRAKGARHPVRVRLLWTPPGVGAGQITLRGDQDRGVLPLSAGARAAVGTWKIAVVGTAVVGGGRLEAASSLGDLRVEAPWVTASIGKARAEQGRTAELVVALSTAKTFEGEARAELLNLPRGVSTRAVTFGAGAKRLVFPLEFAASAPPCRHRSHVLRLRVPGPGGEVVHHFRGGEIRVDRPLPPRRGRPDRTAAPRRPGLSDKQDKNNKNKARPDPEDTLRTPQT